MIARGYHCENGIIADSSSRVITHADSPTDWLKFLVEYYDDELKVFRNLNRSTANLIRNLCWPIEAGKLLWQNHEVEDTQYNYIINHVPGKFLSIKLGKGYGNRLFANFSDMNQYEEEELDNKEKTVDYCIQKAKEAKRIGDATLAAFRELGLDATTLTSPIKVFDKLVLSNMDMVTVDDYPDATIGEIAYSACHGGQVESFVRGYFPMAYNNDLNSAYGFRLAKFPDLRRGSWVYSKDKPHNSILGFCQGRVYIDAPFSPIPYARESTVALEEGEYVEESSFTPQGSWNTVLTQGQIEFIEKYKLGHFEPESGWWWICEPDKLPYPLKQTIESLYSKRDTCSQPAKDLIKRIISGIYGYSRQIIRDRMGDYFNPVLAALCETETTLEVARAVLESGAKPLHIAVDSVITDKPLPIYGTGLGQWKLKAQGPCIIVSSGLAAMSSSDNKPDFSLSIEKLQNMIAQNPTAKEYTMKKLGFVTLGMAIKGRWAELGRIEEVSRTINVDAEAKRYYPESPSCGSDLASKQYGSEPWDVEVLTTLIEV